MISYLEVYVGEVVPKIKEIDLRLKSGEYVSPAVAAKLLGLTEEEIARLRKNNTGDISRVEFLSLMERGTSEVCGLYRRELERNSPITYTAEDIAYIYNIDSSAVQSAFDRLGATQITEYLLADVFSAIWL